MKTGDFVKVKGQGGAWEFGKIMAIEGDEALIGYGGRDLPDDLRRYGTGDWVPLEKLEKEKATAGTVAQVKAGAETQTLADIITEAAPIVKRRWPNLNGRLTRAIEIASNPYGVIAAMTPDTYWVRSQRPGQGNEREWYKVRALVTCECIDCRRGNFCKHQIAVELTKLAKAREVYGEVL